jgi:hypothetical protein
VRRVPPRRLTVVTTTTVALPTRKRRHWELDISRANINTCATAWRRAILRRKVRGWHSKASLGRRKRHAQQVLLISSGSWWMIRSGCIPRRRRVPRRARPCHLTRRLEVVATGTKGRCIPISWSSRLRRISTGSKVTRR